MKYSFLVVKSYQNAGQSQAVLCFADGSFTRDAAGIFFAAFAAWAKIMNK